MRLSEFKNSLVKQELLTFKLPNGSKIPSHFHVTEVGLITREFIDCGGKLRAEKKVNLQLWYSEDFEHRLTSSKLLGIIEKSQSLMDISDELEVEVEYQGETIGKYSLDTRNDEFLLCATLTACLAEDACGIPNQKEIKSLRDLTTVANNNSCSPGGSCC